MPSVRGRTWPWTGTGGELCLGAELLREDVRGRGWGGSSGWGALGAESAREDVAGRGQEDVAVDGDAWGAVGAERSRENAVVDGDGWGALSRAFAGGRGRGRELLVPRVRGWDGWEALGAQGCSLA